MTALQHLCIEDLELKNFISLDEDMQKTIWTIRNTEAVRSNSRDTKFIPWNEHLLFVSTLRNSNTAVFFAVLKAEKLLGVVYLKNIDKTRGSASLGLYKEPSAPSGTGSRLMGVIENIAAVNDITRLVLEVRSGNSAAISLYRKFGFDTTADFDGFLQMEKKCKTARKE